MFLNHELIYQLFEENPLPQLFDRLKAYKFFLSRWITIAWRLVSTPKRHRIQPGPLYKYIQRKGSMYFSLITILKNQACKL
jgi:hypothetical protein